MTTFQKTKRTNVIKHALLMRYTARETGWQIEREQ